jgi:hypothetical protein
VFGPGVNRRHAGPRAAPDDRVRPPVVGAEGRANDRHVGASGGGFEFGSAERVVEAKVCRKPIVGRTPVPAPEATVQPMPRRRVLAIFPGPHAEEADHDGAVSELPVHAQRRDAVLIVAKVGETPPSEQAGVERGEAP